MPTFTHASALLFFMVATAACGTGYPLGAQNAKPLVLNDAEKDLDCPVEDIRIDEEWGGNFEAVGCGRKARYKANCYGVSCVVHKDDEVLVPFRDRTSPEELSPR
ncbi:MAG: hypothetical protein HOW73_34995 [Polyangiaceae bacterium]|nr:hypothetical protein [Polyangiaceae bacterium]